MVAWYWILISVVVSNFLTVLLSYKIDFENLWEVFFVCFVLSLYLDRKFSLCLF